MFEFILLIAAGWAVWYFFLRSPNKPDVNQSGTQAGGDIVGRDKVYPRQTRAEKLRARREARVAPPAPITEQRSRTGDFVTGAVAGAVIDSALRDAAEVRRRRERDEEDESRARRRRYADDTPAYVPDSTQSRSETKSESWFGSSGDSKPDTNSWFGGSGGDSGGGGVTDSWGSSDSSSDSSSSD